ncbi:hypothetical protein QBC44DRAFT_330705 [Cladorrhinum sp. PSN332]|nr:hypothetical protein QBC44DRAFT_330705 [Cladorrhinum sp. PSN332]
MNFTIEAIVAIVALLVALPPTVLVIVKCLRRRQSRRRARDFQLDSAPLIPEVGGLRLARRHHTINATISFVVGEAGNGWDPC